MSRWSTTQLLLPPAPSVSRCGASVTIMLYRPGTVLAAGRYRTTIAASMVSVTEQTNKGANTIQGLPVRSHSPPLLKR